MPSQSLIPVEFVIGCPADKLDARGRAALVKEFATRYGVLVRLNDRTSGPSNYSVTVRGSQKELGRLRDALLHLMKDFNILVNLFFRSFAIMANLFVVVLRMVWSPWRWRYPQTPSEQWRPTFTCWRTSMEWRSTSSNWHTNGRIIKLSGSEAPFKASIKLNWP